MEKGTILKVLGVAALATTLLAVKKKGDFTSVMEAMTIDIHSIRNLRVRGDKFLASLDLAFHNPTEYDMTIITAGLIKLKAINLLYKGVAIGSAVSNKTAFELPAKSNFLVTDIEVSLLYLNLINQWLTSGLDTNIDNYQVHVVIEALGKTWVIEQ